MKRSKCSTRPQIKYLTGSQLRALFAVARKREVREQLLLVLLYRWGCRCSEAIGVRVADVNLERRELSVQGLKGGARRTYSIPADVLHLFRRVRPSGAFLLDSREGDRMSRTTAWRLVVSMMREAGIPPGYGPHALRHSLAVGMLDAGLDLTAVKDTLRHVSIRSSEVYADVTAATRKRFAEVMQGSTAIVKLR